MVPECQIPMPLGCQSGGRRPCGFIKMAIWPDGTLDLNGSTDVQVLQGTGRGGLRPRDREDCLDIGHHCHVAMGRHTGTNLGCADLSICHLSHSFLFASFSLPTRTVECVSQVIPSHGGGSTTE